MQRFSRRRFLTGMAVVVGSSAVGAAGGLAGCSPAPAPTPTQAPKPAQATQAPQKEEAKATVAPAASGKAPVKIIFMSDMGGEHPKVRDEWVRQFNSTHPDIQVEHQPVIQNYADKILTLYAANTPPDVWRYWYDHFSLPAVHEKKLLYKLDDFVKRDNYDLSDFRKGAIEYWRWAGSLYGLPRDYGHQEIYYNLDLFEKEGIAPPPADWTDKTFTFAKFLEVSKALTKSSGGKVTQWGFMTPRWLRGWTPFVYCNGGAVVKQDQNGLATEMAMDSDQSVEALQFLQDMMHKDKVAPRPEMEAESGAQPDVFMTGKVAMFINNPGVIQTLRQITAFKWDVASLPIGKGERRGTGGGGTCWSIAGACKAPESAWEFLKHISTQQAELEEVRIGGTTPSRTSVITSPEFLQPGKPPSHASSLADAQEYVVRDPVNPKWAEVLREVVNKELDRLWDGSQSAKDVTKTIKQKGDASFKAT